MRLQKNCGPARWQNERARIRRAALPCFPLLFLKDECGMRQRPFIFQNVVIDLQRRQRIGRAVTKGRTDLTFHSENSRALHFREIGKDVGMRCEIDNGNCGATFLTTSEMMLTLTSAAPSSRTASA